jgi:hypothetical protein
MIRIAILDDYQNASLEMADWSPLAGRAGHRYGSRGPSEISWWRIRDTMHATIEMTWALILASVRQVALEKVNTQEKNLTNF